MSVPGNAATGTRQHPAPPPPGSRRYFTLLYTPAPQREALSTLLALSDEIASEPAARTDHGIAHARLEWWQHEAQRFAQGSPEHPWLRTLLAEHPHAAGLDLQRLVQAAAVDLANRTLAQREGDALRRALFELAAGALCDRLTPAQCAAVGELGASLQRLEHEPADGEARAMLQRHLQAIDDARQAQLAPLLVWLALAARPARRRGRLLEGLADNLVAWSAARRAARGRFRLL